MRKSSRMKRFTAVGLTGAAVLVMSGTAHAASAGGLRASAAAPTCVKVTVDKGTISKTAYVTNKCSTTKRVKVVWSFAPDSDCNTLKPGQKFKTKRGLAPQFDGLALC
ncbi:MULTISPECIES: hypothetical protein [Streptomyces]|uniref:Alpha amylase inhibitor n=1 Tax=Streptomyces gougerotii TaxID=53448 RepID=A0A8H9HAN7_9ACTN|nr:MULTISPECIES: hypothetical protein [Streptomyces]MDQ0292223.1 hypothetical protein [Streptomyces sp. DSM 41037]WPR54284.1 hypothetical protein SJI45_28030 [Streptomyces sp. S399]GFH79564.1 hypothetical protein Sgou_42340 [Streptomyces gougerotii]GGU52762.1 hypothetical protein GCM10010227_01850 [Streptomyces gougerotii]